jgi:hypothetical protein
MKWSAEQRITTDIAISSGVPENQQAAEERLDVVA